MKSKVSTIYKVKPLLDFQIWFAISALIFLYGVVIIALVILYATDDEQTMPWIGTLIAIAITAAIFALMVFIGRVCYRGRLIVTADEVIKMHGKKVQFKIKRQDLLWIGCRKVSIFKRFFTCFAPLVAETAFGLISFRFYQAEVITERKFDGYFTIHTLAEAENADGLQEFVEGVTYRQAKKISELLNIALREIKF